MDRTKIFDLLTNQTRRFDEFFLLFNYLIVVPIQTIIILIISFDYLGPISFIILTIIALITYANAFYSQKLSILRNKSMLFTRKRLQLFNEIIRNLSLIRTYSIENRFLNRLFLLRRIEIQKLHRPLMNRCVMLSLSFISSRLILYVSILISIYLFDCGGKFTIETIMVSIELFEKLRHSLIWSFPQAISSLIDMQLVCKNIDRFLSEPEHRSNVLTNVISNEKSVSVQRLQLPNCSDPSKSICLQIKPNQILWIIGSIGSGKVS